MLGDMLEPPFLAFSGEPLALFFSKHRHLSIAIATTENHKAINLKEERCICLTALEIFSPVNQPLLCEPAVRQNITAGANSKAVNVMPAHGAKQREEARALQAPIRPCHCDLKLQ